MADLADVEQALVDLILATLYPSGTDQASVIGSQCRIYRGWPVPSGLNSDLSAGIVNVTVSPDREPGKTTTRYLPRWDSTPGVPTTTLTADGNTLQIGGTPSAGDVVGALVNGIAYAYRVLAADTTDLVAASLAAVMTGSLSVSVVGATITVNGPAVILPRVVRDATAALETRRQEKNIRIICWCPDPISRDTVAATVDRKLVQTTFLTAADGSSVRLSYQDTNVCDQAQNASLYRRDLVYTAEYPTISIIGLPSMLFGDVAIAGSSFYG